MSSSPPPFGSPSSGTPSDMGLASQPGTPLATLSPPSQIIYQPGEYQLGSLANQLHGFWRSRRVKRMSLKLKQLFGLIGNPTLFPPCLIELLRKIAIRLDGTSLILAQIYRLYYHGSHLKETLQLRGENGSQLFSLKAADWFVHGAFRVKPKPTPKPGPQELPPPPPTPPLRQSLGSLPPAGMIESGNQFGSMLLTHSDIDRLASNDYLFPMDNSLTSSSRKPSDFYLCL